MKVPEYEGTFNLPFKFFDNPNSDVLLVFLPSVRSKDIYPYYPRLSWSEYLSRHCNVLYVADPFQTSLCYKDAGGSWFFDENGYFCLPIIGEWIKQLAADNKIRKTIFYGSSMGGYASLILGCTVPSSIAFAECPQVFLEKHPGSASVIRHHGHERDVSSFSVDHYLKNSISSNLHIIVSAHDHHLIDHILPFIDIAKSNSRDFIRINFSIYSDHFYPKGHIALNYDDAKIRIMHEIKTA